VVVEEGAAVTRVLLAMALVLAACGGGGGGGGKGPTSPATGGGGHPDGTGPVLDLTLPAVDGGDISLAAHRGKIVVLHIFTTWSLAAQAEVDALSAADKADDVVVIGVALDPEGRMLVAPWRNGADVHYLIALADEPTRAGASPLGPLPAVPITIVVDKTGRLAGRADRQLTRAELDAMIAAAR
jgi:hypothetical protein